MGGALGRSFQNHKPNPLPIVAGPNEEGGLEMKKPLVAKCLAVLGLAPALVNAQLPGMDSDVAKITKMLELPIDGFSYVENKAGQRYFISKNGRFVVKGAIYDMWHGGRPIETAEDVERYAQRINVEQLDKLDLDDLLYVKYGSGDNEIVTFITPDCGYCDRAVEELTRFVDENRGYSARFLIFPAGSPKAQEEARLAVCSFDQDKGALEEALLSSNYQKLQQFGSNRCDLMRAQKTLVTAQIFGVSKVPFLIAPDGRIHRGLPRDVGIFIHGAEK